MPEIVNEQTGEITCPSCSVRSDELDALRRNAQDDADHIKQLQNTMRGLMLKIARLERDEEKELRLRPYYQQAHELFDFYKKASGRSRVKMDVKRYNMIESHLKNEPPDRLRLVILGVLYEPSSKQLKNGGTEVYDTWENAFDGRDRVERYGNRAPKAALEAWKKGEPVEVHHLHNDPQFVRRRGKK